MEKPATDPEKSSPPTSTGVLLWFARYGAIPSLLFLSLFLLSTFFWAARPAFYYMEFILLFLIAPLILLIAASYWPLYRALRKWKSFPSAEARSLLPCWIALLILAAALLVSLPWQVPMKMVFSLTTRAPLEQFIPNIREEAASDDAHPIQAGIYSFRNKLSDHRNQGSDMTIFRFESDGEQAFVHAPAGIDKLNYNTGTAGHLMGDWYWFCED